MDSWRERLFMYIVLGAILTILYNMFRNVVRAARNKRLIKCMNLLNDDNLNFFIEIEDYLEHVSGEEFQMKGKILKMYGLIKFGKIGEAHEVLNEMDFMPLIYRNRMHTKFRITDNEDSFFYYCFLSSAHLYSLNQKEFIRVLKLVIDDYKIHLQYSLFFNLFDAVIDFYNKQFDCGKDVLEEVASGKFNRKKYSRPMKDLYMNVAKCYLYRLALDQHNEEDISKYKEDVLSFSESNIGNILANDLNLIEK